MELGFYLASWGMFRGSSDLLNKSMVFFEPLIKTLANAPTEILNLDVDKYDGGTWDLIKSEQSRIIKALEPLRNKNSQVLITKIMMGVYGNVPAFDQYVQTHTPPSLPLDAETQSIGMSASAHQAGGGIWTGLKVEHCWPAIGGN